MIRTVDRPSFGAALIDANRAGFRLWAPSEDRVWLEIEGGVRKPMHSAGEGWFAVEAEAGPGTRYRFRVGGDQAVPDPASRAQHGDIHGWSVVTDPDAYLWRNLSWRGRPWNEAVIYELHVGAFGGFQGVAAKLDYLANLGVTAIELMPVAEFPGGRNWGYDGLLPFAPESSYGTPEDLKSLIDRAHGLGLMVFLDVVYNHFGPDGNYLGLYAAPFFRRDATTPWGPAIDFGHPQVRAFFIENALYWLNEYRFDGLRLDAVHMIPDKGFLIELASRVKEECEPDRHVHLILENDDNSASLLAEGFTAQWNDDAHHVLHVLLTGERESYYADYAIETAAKLARALSEGFVFQGEAASARQGGLRGERSNQLPPTAFINFLQNHDQIGNRALGERLTASVGMQALRAARTALLLAPQIPMLFMGEEFGSQTPFLYFTSHGEELAQAVREGRRREFSGFAAFADPAQRERIPDPNAESTFAACLFVEPAADDPELAFTRFLLRARARLTGELPGSRALPATVLGPAAVHAAWLLRDRSTLHLALNLGATAVPAEPVSIRELLVEWPGGSARTLRDGELAPNAAIAWLER